MPFAQVRDNPSTPLLGHANGRRGRLCRGPASLALKLTVIAGLFAVLPLTAASLPDPLWIGGVYDGGDYDDLIATSGDVGPAALPPVIPQAARTVWTLRPADAHTGPGALSSVFLARAPPMALGSVARLPALPLVSWHVLSALVGRFDGPRGRFYLWAGPFTQGPRG